MEYIGIILSLVNTCGVLVVLYRVGVLIYNVGEFIGKIKSETNGLEKRLKRVEDRCEERCMVSS